MTTYQHIDSNDEWIVDDFGNLVGVRARIDGVASADKNFVFGERNPVTGGITKIWTGTQAEYDAIAVKDDSTLYVIVAG